MNDNMPYSNLDYLDKLENDRERLFFQARERIIDIREKAALEAERKRQAELERKKKTEEYSDKVANEIASIVYHILSKGREKYEVPASDLHAEILKDYTVKSNLYIQNNQNSDFLYVDLPYNFPRSISENQTGLNISNIDEEYLIKKLKSIGINACIHTPEYGKVVSGITLTFYRMKRYDNERDTSLDFSK